jgi:hypothetical protein
VRGMPDDLWWRFAQQAAGRPRTAAATRRRQLLAWLFDWVVSPVFAIAVLVTAWFSASGIRLSAALVVLFVVLAVLRMKLVGPVRNDTAIIFGIAPADDDPARLRRLWLGLLGSSLLLAGARAYDSTLEPRDPHEVVWLAASLAWMGILVSVLMLVNEHARRWRRRRRGRSGE